MNGMISCKNCMAQNSLDSAFCKKCGTTLPADEVQQAKDKLEATVADGFRIFSTGRTDEAMQVAEAAVTANPTSTAALSLKAMCHERVGQISEALECHEKVLAIDPDSMIDKIKVNDLRNLLVARSSIAATPDRRMAIASAVAAAVLVASIGLVIAKTGSRGADKVASNVPAVDVQAKGSHFDQTVAVPGAQGNPSRTDTSVQPNGPTPNAGNTASAPSRTSDNSETGTSRNDSARLPHLSSDAGGQLPDPHTPVLLTPDKGIGAAQNVAVNNTAAKPNSQPNGDPAPNEDTNASAGNQTKQAPGIMEISVVSGPGKPASDSSDPSTHPNGVQALLKTARGQYQIGNYPAAANSYERALRAGASPASGNQRLAECYEKIGRNSEAVAAYNRAISALQSELNSGHGDKDRVSRALDSCQQAVKVLGG